MQLPQRVIILAHVFTTVPAEDLQSYFLHHNIKNLWFIGHPLFFRPNRPGSHYRFYIEGRLAEHVQLQSFRLPALIQYFYDLSLTLWWVLRRKKHWDVMIALDNLNAFAGLILKRMGIVDKVVYYTIDFVPQRFHFAPLNELYHLLDRYCLKNCDATWNLSERFAEGRDKVRGLKIKDYPKQYVVPIGIWFNRVPRRTFTQIQAHTLAYAGGLAPHQGIQLVLSAIPLILKKIPDFRFKIIGIGDYEPKLRQQVQSLHISDFVDFLGYQERHEDVEKILSTCGVAAAMYDRSLALWSYYADPSKIKTYLATSLPIITTDLTHIAYSLEQRGCGKVIPYDKKAFAEQVIRIMSDQRLHQRMRKKATAFASEFDWTKIYDQALETLYKVAYNESSVSDR